MDDLEKVQAQIAELAKKAEELIKEKPFAGLFVYASLSFGVSTYSLIAMATRVTIPPPMQIALKRAPIAANSPDKATTAQIPIIDRIT